jgi:hypothetical protein
MRALEIDSTIALCVPVFRVLSYVPWCAPFSLASEP